jgi:hypothetical protein
VKEKFPLKWAGFIKFDCEGRNQPLMKSENNNFLGREQQEERKSKLVLEKANFKLDEDEPVLIGGGGTQDAEREQ